jgi:hypothetical protein
MHSIVLKRSGMPGNFMLVERVHGPAETDYTPIIRLEDHEAHAIAGPHTGIEFLHASDAPAGNVAKLSLTIEPVPDRQPGTRPWRMRIGDELVTRCKDGEEIPVRLTDDHVISLVDYAHPLFPPDEPDWERRKVEVHEEQAIDLRALADEAAAKATSLRAAWEAKQAANQPQMDI